MNRPKYPRGSKDLSFEKFMCAESKYYKDIEKYCDELEQSNKSLSNAYDDCLATLHFWEEEYHKYRKALDKACQLLDNNDIPYTNKNGIEIRGISKDKWKEYLLKDE